MQIKRARGKSLTSDLPRALNSGPFLLSGQLQISKVEITLAERTQILTDEGRQEVRIRHSWDVAPREAPKLHSWAWVLQVARSLHSSS